MTFEWEHDRPRSHDRYARNARNGPDIACGRDARAPRAGKSVEVSYRYTGLSAAGDAYISGMTDEAFREFIGNWDAAIREYLKRIKIASR
ncbi:MAG: hypothetical protein Q7S40_05175 [Opitutaceae bacterium]|nr:hypothetical protein [Opitutaceae bacterium]